MITPEPGPCLQDDYSDGPGSTGHEGGDLPAFTMPDKSYISYLSIILLKVYSSLHVIGEIKRGCRLEIPG